jgi:hypothetical protein
MPNRWIEHVRDYAAKNNISYGCAVTEAKASYVKNPPKVPKTNRKMPPRVSKRQPRVAKPKTQKSTMNREKEIEDFIKEIMAM